MLHFNQHNYVLVKVIEIIASSDKSLDDVVRIVFQEASKSVNFIKSITWRMWKAMWRPIRSCPTVWMLRYSL